MERSDLRRIIREEFTEVVSKNDIREFPKNNIREFPKNKIRDIGKLINKNYTTIAYIIIAKELGDKKLVSTFASIEKKSNVLGYLPMNLSVKRYELYKTMMKEVEKTFINYRDIYEAL